ncbi:hypothetical protein EVAR_65426_1 [Eumeta japonica]|uniref:Uncharacterized protein n=1 Tax=Eumeta variegata TaxID=151549 RepID=A0A4C1YLC8_EUMVA|nr:hypothetical protein EVAR_65426_1 [Eumeta japonica]
MDYHVVLYLHVCPAPLKSTNLFMHHVSFRFAPVTQKKCILPQYPENGSYIVINDTKAGPGDAFDDISLILYNSDEYFELEVVFLACARGAWSREILKRVPRRASFAFSKCRFSDPPRSTFEE